MRVFAEIRHLRRAAIRSVSKCLPIATIRRTRRPVQCSRRSSLLVFALVILHSSGTFDPRPQLTLLAARAGVGAGSARKVTYNGVPIRIRRGCRLRRRRQNLQARGAARHQTAVPEPAAGLTSRPRFRPPRCSGNKYVAFRSTNPNSGAGFRGHPDRRDGRDDGVQQPFETITEISEQVDPIEAEQDLCGRAPSS